MKHLVLIAVIAVFIVSCSLQSKTKLTERELKVGDSIELEWGQCSLQETGKDACLYLEIDKWPEKELIIVPGLKTRVHDIFLKEKPKYHFAWRFYDGDLQIHTSSFKGMDKNMVLVIRTKGKVTIAGPKEEEV